MRFTCLGSFSHIRHTLGARLTSFGAQLWLTLSWCWKGEKKELLALPVSFSVEKIMSPMDWEYALVLLSATIPQRDKNFWYIMYSRDFDFNFLWKPPKQTWVIPFTFWAIKLILKALNWGNRQKWNFCSDFQSLWVVYCCWVYSRESSLLYFGV